MSWNDLCIVYVCQSNQVTAKNTNESAIQTSLEQGALVSTVQDGYLRNVNIAHRQRETEIRFKGWRLFEV